MDPALTPTTALKEPHMILRIAENGKHLVCTMYFGTVVTQGVRGYRIGGKHSILQGRIDLNYVI